MARVAVVTGGTRGIGCAISVALKDAGYRVAANYAGNDAAAQQCNAETGIPVFKFDVSDFEACVDGVKIIEAALGPIEVLVNNAGITRDATMHRMNGEQWDAVLRQTCRRASTCQGGHRGNARAQLWPHRQHRLGQRPGRAIWPSQLRRG